MDIDSEIQLLDLDDESGENPQVVPQEGSNTPKGEMLLPRYPADKDMRYKGTVGVTKVWDTFRFGIVRLFDRKDTDCVPIVKNQNIASLYGLMETYENMRYSYLLEYLPGGTLETNLRKNGDMTAKLLIQWLTDTARGLYYVCNNCIPYGSLDLNKIYTSGRRAKIEHPLLVEARKLSFLDGLHNFAQLVEKSLQLWKNKTGEAKCLYLGYLAETMRKFTNTLMKRAENTAEQDAKRALYRVITVLSDMIPGECVDRNQHNSHVFLSFEQFKSSRSNVEKTEKVIKRPTEEEDQVVPIDVKRFLLLDLGLPILNGNIPGPQMAKTIPTFTETSLGRCRVIQVADSKHGQGYYLEIEHGRFGICLVKYLENRNEITQQLQLYKDLKLSEKAIKEHKKCEQAKNPMRETLLASKLDHPNVMKVLALISSSNKPEDIIAIIMEGASLGTLEIYAKKAQLPDSTIKNYAGQLADALRYCHDELNIIHRDVRPRNIYVHDNGENIKLGNFGYAREEDSEMKTANKGDELYYKAPEMIYSGNITCYSFPVDVYGYALVLWSISHGGSRPFWDQNRMLCANSFTFRTYLEASNVNRPEIRKDLNPLLVYVIRRCWVNQVDGATGRPAMAEIVDILQ